MKNKNILIISTSILVVIILVIVTAVLFSRSDKHYDDYEATEYFPKDPTNLASKIEADVNGDDISFTFDIDEYYDYYVGMYIRSALREYIAEYNISEPVSFSISKDLYCLVQGDPTNIVGEYECSNGEIIIIYMHRDTDEWEWEVK